MQTSELVSIRIEPDWNVKNFTHNLLIEPRWIRIEPDWNVKVSGGGRGGSSDAIRIEPDWNVKPSWSKALCGKYVLEYNYLELAIQ